MRLELKSNRGVAIRAWLSALVEGRAPAERTERSVLRFLGSRLRVEEEVAAEVQSAFRVDVLEESGKKGRALLALDDDALEGVFRRRAVQLLADLLPNRRELRGLRDLVASVLEQPLPKVGAIPPRVVEQGRLSRKLVAEAVSCLVIEEGFEGASPAKLARALWERYGAAIEPSVDVEWLHGPGHEELALAMDRRTDAATLCEAFLQGLTDEEALFLALAAAGMTQQAIADQAGVSVGTVNRRLQEAQDKLDDFAHAHGMGHSSRDYLVLRAIEETLERRAQGLAPARRTRA